MFRTYPESEMPIPIALAANGERSWHWIELPLCITYFIVTVRVKDGSQSFHRTLMFSDINSVLQVSREANEGYELERVDVLIPTYLHSGTGYKLSQIIEVWESNDDYRARSFVLGDGSTILDAHSDAEHAARADFSLAARF